MISSMTGYGRGEVTENMIAAVAEVRTVNNRYLEVAARLPRTMTLRENEVKELVRGKFVRGKINIVLTVTHDNSEEIPLKINSAAAKAYYRLLTDLRKAVNIREKVTLAHLLQYPEILQINEFEKGDEEEWRLLKKALIAALDQATEMRRREGSELMKDLMARIKGIDSRIDEIERTAKGRISEERNRLEQRLRELLADQSIIDSKRLELEIAILADKLDVTEECVRFRSHNKFFISDLAGNEASGRRLNFLIQEMNREANTIGAKASNAEIAHIVVEIKEELEKIREQLQNIE